MKLILQFDREIGQIGLDITKKKRRRKIFIIYFYN